MSSHEERMRSHAERMGSQEESTSSHKEGLSPYERVMLSIAEVDAVALELLRSILKDNEEKAKKAAIFKEEVKASVTELVVEVMLIPDRLKRLEYIDLRLDPLTSQLLLLEELVLELRKATGDCYEELKISLQPAIDFEVVLDQTFQAKTVEEGYRLYSEIDKSTWGNSNEKFDAALKQSIEADTARKLLVKRVAGLKMVRGMC